MLLVGQVTTPQEAYEMESIVRVFVVAKRTKYLALQVKK